MESEAELWIMLGTKWLRGCWKGFWYDLSKLISHKFGLTFESLGYKTDVWHRS